MAHYAFLDDNNVVIDVIVGRDETEVIDDITDWEDFYSKERGLRCLRTSYNTVNNTHQSGRPFRGNYASIGMIYDEDNDLYLQQKPYPSWVLDKDTATWTSPIEKPENSIEKTEKYETVYEYLTSLSYELSEEELRSCLFSANAIKYVYYEWNEESISWNKKYIEQDLTNLNGVNNG